MEKFITFCFNGTSGNEIGTDIQQKISPFHLDNGTKALLAIDR
jgi:hypothetical protein